MYTAIAEQTPVEELVAAAIAGDDRAWEEMIRTYQSIITSVCRRYRLDSEQAADVSQTVWLQVADNLRGLREPRALPGWIKTIANRLALSMRRSSDRSVPTDFATSGPLSSTSTIADDHTDVESIVLAEELRTAVRNGLAQLPQMHRELLTMLIADPPLPYREISARLSLPTGSIGPTRARALRRLVSTTAMRGLVEA